MLKWKIKVITRREKSREARGEEEVEKAAILNKSTEKGLLECAKTGVYVVLAIRHQKRVKGINLRFKEA
ncbi:hypothetical protein AAG906_040957 [Vitis piasezkii]